MSKKNLSYFMRNHEPQVVKAAGPDTICDENGAVIELEIKVLSQADIQKINNNYRKRAIATDRKGNPMISNGEVVWKTEMDSAKASRHMIVEALQYPDLKDPELMEFYKCVDVTDMPLKVFPTSAEYNHVARAVMVALGLVDAGAADESDDATLEEAKN